MLSRRTDASTYAYDRPARLSRHGTREDIEATKQLVAAGRVLDIELVDHLIIGHQRFVSLKEHLRWD